jgi:hypothetical protein
MEWRGVDSFEEILYSLALLPSGRLVRVQIQQLKIRIQGESGGEKLSEGQDKAPHFQFHFQFHFHFHFHFHSFSMFLGRYEKGFSLFVLRFLER